MNLRHFTCIATVALVLVSAGPAGADDRDLLRSTGAPPNVLLILDSGAPMVHDPETNTINFLAGGDDQGDYTDFLVDHYGETYLTNLFQTADFRTNLDRGAKLPQAKRALRALFATGFEFNYGFSYYEKSQISIKYKNYIYRVENIWNALTGTVETSMNDGTVVGDVKRFGDDENVRGNADPDPFYPVLFGRDGTEAIVINANPTGNNTGDEDDPDNGDIRFARFLVDPVSYRSWAEMTEADRVAGNFYYYPAYDWDQLPASIQNGLDGSSTWAEVATANSIDITDPAWKRQLNALAMTAIQNEQIGGQTLYIKEGYQKYVNTIHAWQAVAPPVLCPGGCPETRIAEMSWEQDFVLYDHPWVEDKPASGTLSSVNYQGSADCAGYLVEPANSKYPIVQVGRPDPGDGSTPDNRPLIDTYLNPQTTPVFYFPTESDDFLPAVREDYIPLTETITAIGRRPIKDTVNAAKFYFNQIIDDYDDPLRMCRANYLILITDGEETCAGGQAICSAADNFPGAIYTVYLGTEANAVNPDMTDVECIAERSGGAYFVAGNEDELLNALLSIARDIEERTRGFSSPIVPSVETSTKQVAYISTFTPYEERSIWRGHLRAYPINPFTGVVADLRPDNTPDAATALWDAGDTLAERWDWGGRLDNPWDNGETGDQRKMYFPSLLTGTLARGVFSYPGDDAAAFLARKELGFKLFGSWADVYSDADPLTSDEQHEERVLLRNIIDFMRGVQFGTDADGNKIGLRHVLFDGGGLPIPSSSYHWCGAVGDVGTGSGDTSGCANGFADPPLGIEKLGDVFHSTPQRMAAPACFACYLSDYQNYRSDFLEVHKFRRTVLFAGSDDGAMHAFDAGLWDINGDSSYTPPQPPQYDAGTGRELFAWVPSGVMHSFNHLATTTDQTWTVDGTPTVADVFIDKSFSGTPVASDREWRSLLLFGLRRGGRSYTALDVTQPDTYNSDGEPSPSGTVAFETRDHTIYSADPLEPPTVVPYPVLTADSLSAGAARDASISTWPELRWEFFDISNEDAASGNTEPDLGQTWSRPLVGFVRVTDGTDTADRMVAFFGGGYSPLGATPPADRVTGNYIYGIDVETGAILYKEKVVGMVPGHVQGLDLDLDGFLEKIYFATTAGNIYRAKVGTTGVLSSGRVAATWDPELIFDAPEYVETLPDGTTKTWYQHFFQRPTLVPISFNADGTAQLAIAIGSGNRDAIFQKNPEPHRFYVFKEPADTTPVTALTEDDLQGMDIDFFATNTNTENFLASTDVEGWYLEFYEAARTENWEKVNTGALVFNEYIIFSTFNPIGEITAIATAWNSDGDPIAWACRRGGGARTYVTNLFNSNPQPGEDLFFDHGEDTAMATDAIIYLGADGRIHVEVMTENLQLEDPIQAKELGVPLMSWKEN